MAAANNRPEYRDPKTPRAVKVYTIAQESRYLIFEHVPALGVIDNLLTQCQSILKSNECIENHGVLDNHESANEFNDVIWIQLRNAKEARQIKQHLDDRPFFANRLRVSYAPEYETVDDFRNKLLERRLSPLFHHTWQPSKKKKQQYDRRQLKEENAASKTVVVQQEQPLIGPIPFSSTSTHIHHTAQHNNHNPKAKTKRRRI